MGDGEATQADAPEAEASAHKPLGPFEVGFGVLLPCFCLYADPLVFKTSSGTLSFWTGPDPLHPHLWAAAWAFVLFQGLVLVMHGLRPPRKETSHAFRAGLFLMGAFGAFAIGVRLLPYSFFGVMVLVGVLGLVPFVTCYCFLRRAVQAFRASRAWMAFPREVALLLGMAMAIAVPVTVWGAGRYVTNMSLASLEHGRKGCVDLNTTRLRRWSFLIDMDDLVQRHQATSDPGEQRRLARVYEAVTGQSVERRLEERAAAAD